MARDCSDRQRGANWRNDPPGFAGRGPPGKAIGQGDAVDREYEVSLYYFECTRKRTEKTY
jgi:splicing factor 1